MDQSARLSGRYKEVLVCEGVLQLRYPVVERVLFLDGPGGRALALLFSVARFRYLSFVIRRLRASLLVSSGGRM